MINGVKINELETHNDERGFFREIVRFPKIFKDFPVGQISHSLVNEGIVKAWHGHTYQYQWNYIITGIINVALYDNRVESQTYKETMEFTVEDVQPKLYFFPPGVLHGYKCIQGPVHMIYVTSGIYDLEDEVRMPMHIINKNIFN